MGTETAMPSAAPAATPPAGAGDAPQGVKPPETPGATPVDKPGDKPGDQPGSQPNLNLKKFTVDGKTVEIDLSKQEDLEALIQKGLAADRRFQEASKWRKDAEMITELLRNHPMRLLEHTAKMAGKDPRKVVEEWLWENHIKVDQMSPEQKEAHKAKMELERLREESRKNKLASQQKKFDEMRTHFRSTFEKDIIGALEEGGLPKTPRTVQRMAAYMLQAHKRGHKVGAKDVVSLVREDYHTDISQLFGPLNGEVLAKLVGDENLKKLREYELKKMQDGGGAPPPAAPMVSGGEPERKSLTPDEWREQLDKRVGK